MRSAHGGFAGIFVLAGLAIFGAITAVVGIREFKLPETRALEEAAGPPWPQIPSGLSRPSAIRPGDVIAVRVANENEVSGEFTVSDAGAIRIAMVGRLVVGGRDTDGAADAVRAALADGFFKNPVVTVAVVQPRNRTVFVIGQVQWAGTVTTAGELSLDRVLTLAGGATAAAGRTAYVVRPAQPRAPAPTPIDDAKARVLSYDIDADGATLLEDGDTVFIRAAGMVGIVGKITNPGVYSYVPGMTAEQLFVIAGGLAEHASAKGLKISRFVNGTRQNIDATSATVLTPGDIVAVRGRRIF